MYQTAQTLSRQSPAAWLITRFQEPELLGFSHHPQASDDFEFIALLDAYQPLGGIARAADVATNLVFSSAVQVGVLAHWIERRQVLSVVWNEVRWLPLFQFGRTGAIPCPALEGILKDLATIHEQWGVAAWFCKPNLRLDNSAPATVLNHDAQAVVQAARAELAYR